jgi:hypothetical protein
MTTLRLNEPDLSCPSVNLSFLFFYLPACTSFGCFRRSNKITSMCCRPTMTKDEKRHRKKTSRADACYTTRQDDSKLYLTRARALSLIVLDDRRYAQKSNSNRKENIMVAYSFVIYNSIIKKKQQLHISRLQKKKKKKKKEKKKEKLKEKTSS